MFIVLSHVQHKKLLFSSLTSLPRLGSTLFWPCRQNVDKRHPLSMWILCVLSIKEQSLCSLIQNPTKTPSPPNQLTNPTCSIPIRDGFCIPFMKPSPKCPLVFLLVTRHSVPYIVIPFICDSQELHRTVENFEQQRVMVAIVSSVR